LEVGQARFEHGLEIGLEGYVEICEWRKALYLGDEVDTQCGEAAMVDRKTCWRRGSNG
jgi:hypothetical protein